MDGWTGAKKALVDGMNHVCAIFPAFVSFIGAIGIPALKRIGVEKVWVAGRG